MRTLVTGATGFIGRHLVERLAAGGDEVRCLVPTAELFGAFGDLDVEYAQADITRAGALAEAVEGVDVVYHLAGATLRFSRAEFHRVNELGTRLVAETCAELENPPVLVFISSLAAAGPSPIDDPRDETGPSRPVSDYGRSKRAAEVALEALADRLPTTVLRPPGVFGPRELYMLEHFRSVKKGWNVVPGRAPMRLSLIHVAELVEALILAAGRGRRLDGSSLEGPGPHRGVYFVAHDERPTFEDLGVLIAEALGRPGVRTVRVPLPICWALAGFGELAGRARGKPLLLNFDKIREASAGSWTCRTDRAAEELGFSPRFGMAERLRQTADWYREARWL